MEITFNNDVQKAREKYEVLWKLSAKKNYRIIAVNFIIGIIFLVANSIYGYTFKKFSKDNSVTYNLNLFLSFGIAFIFLSIIYMYYMYKTKYKFF